MRAAVEQEEKTYVKHIHEPEMSSATSCPSKVQRNIGTVSLLMHWMPTCTVVGPHISGSTLH